MHRRDVLKQAAALAAGAVVGSGYPGAVRAQTTPSDTTRFFPGFKRFSVQTSGAVINGVVGGQGPPLLLLHGAPRAI